MNAAAEVIVPDLQQQLEAAYAARAEARAALTHAQATRHRGHESLAAARSELERHTAEKVSWKQRGAERAHAWLLAGNSGAPPILVSDPEAEGKLLHAQLNVESIESALQVLKQQETHAQSALTAAERAVARVADAILGMQPDTLAAEILEHARAIVACDKKLRAARGNGPDTPINRLTDVFNVSDHVARALKIARDIRLLDELNVPISQLHGLSNDNSAEVAALVARRAALIAGPTGEPA